MIGLLGDFHFLRPLWLLALLALPLLWYALRHGGSDDKSWRAAMLAYRSRMQSALDGLDATPMEPGWREVR